MMRGFDLNAIPEDVLWLVAQELPIREMVRVSTVQKKWHQLFHVDKLTKWQSYYERHFGKLVGDNDFKEQTIAAVLYHAANNAKRADEKQRLFYYLREFLAPFRKEPPVTKNWVLPYIVRMYGHGWGVLQDLRKAANYLSQCFIYENPKAALLLTEFWDYAAFNSFKYEKLNITWLLRKSYEAGEYEALKWLGHFVRNRNINTEFDDHIQRSLIVNADRREACGWYWTYYEKGFEEGLEKWTCIQKQILWAIHAADERKEEARTVEKTLLDEQSKFRDSAMIACCIGDINWYFLDKQKALSECLSAKALNPLCAYSYDLLANIYTETGARNELKALQKEIVSLGGKIYGMRHSECIDGIKVAVVENGILLTAHYAPLYELSKHYEKLWDRSTNVSGWKIVDPVLQHKVLVWLAFLARCGCAAATDMLLHGIPHNENHAFLIFARGLMDLYGVITQKGDVFAPGRSPDRQEALTSFRKAYALRPTILEDYIAVSEEEHPELMSEGLKHDLRKIWERSVVPKQEVTKASKLKM